MSAQEWGVLALSNFLFALTVVMLSVWYAIRTGGDDK